MIKNIFISLLSNKIISKYVRSATLTDHSLDNKYNFSAISCFLVTASLHYEFLDDVIPINK